MLRIPVIPKRAPQSFNIRDAQQLMRKLTVEISQFIESNSSSALSGYLALNIAMTAWHMVDWVSADMNAAQCKLTTQYLEWPVPYSKKTRDELAKAVTKKCEALQTCRVIATAGKHAVVNCRPDPSLATRFEIVRPNPNEANLPGEGLSYVWVIERDGKEYLAEEVFKKAHRFWEDLLSRLGIIEDPVNGRGRRGW